MKNRIRPVVLIINAHLHQDREVRRDPVFLQPGAGLHVASVLGDDCDVTLYHEMWSGPLRPDNLPAADIVFLSGLQADFDRMRQLSYYFRRNGAITVAGGNVCTLYPEFCTRFFDVVCAGGVENAADVISDYIAGTLEPIYRRPQQQLTNYDVRYELLNEASISPLFHLVEASRGCNFKCDFCVIPAEGARHAMYGVDSVMAAINASLAASPPLSLRRWYPGVLFIDNNFSNNLSYVRALCERLRDHPRVRFWVALITQDMLLRADIMTMLGKAGCRAVFTGLESLDPEFLKQHNKVQNLKQAHRVREAVAHAARQGIVVMYGHLFDPRLHDVEVMRRQLSELTRDGELSPPTFYSWVSPLLGTPVFQQGAEAGELRANLRIRDLDGVAIAYSNSVDDDDTLSRFANEVYYSPQRLIGMRNLLHSFVRGLIRLPLNKPVAHLLHYHNSIRAASRSGKSLRPRNFLGATDILDPQYEWLPGDVSPSDQALYFDPLLVTDAKGRAMDWTMPEGDKVPEPRLINTVQESAVNLEDVERASVLADVAT